MKKREKVAYSILAAIPVIFVLFLLAMINVLFLLLGIIVVLMGLLILKKCRPEWFSKPSKGKDVPDPGRKGKKKEIKTGRKVFMVLVNQDNMQEERISISKTPFKIGRLEYNDLVLSDSKRISRDHLMIEYSPSEEICYGVDSSKFGTYLNNERMLRGQRTKLGQGDYLMIDGHRFVVEYANYKQEEVRAKKGTTPS